MEAPNDRWDSAPQSLSGAACSGNTRCAGVKVARRRFIGLSAAAITAGLAALCPGRLIPGWLAWFRGSRSQTRSDVGPQASALLCRPVPAPDTRCEHGAGGARVTGSTGVVPVNDTGAAIFGDCDGERTVAEIAARLAAEHSLPREQALNDTVDFLNSLYRRSLVTFRYDQEIQIVIG